MDYKFTDFKKEIEKNKSKNKGVSLKNTRFTPN